ncbi:NAD(P)/FAD-dependent oxidoreductase [Natronomonas salina]|uniref:NAD(P)/FAD-dependent oxidoreductase n=1 Tax=Natronomonas salina TaxID=1710540 RepID=UPI0015B523C3|nr:NAD(P)/FAD-dependent oxidoreductase [Natronomonas salina]QLD90983.1 NAD(P)/FAD-dependent oxidoreductase [Natronomonas salina]
MRDRRAYEVVVVGGGPAGMTAALYATRLGHRTAVFEKEGGRHAAVSHVHNLYGVSEDVSGQELAAHAVAQLEEYGGDYHLDPVDEVRRTGGDGEGDSRFVVEATHATVEADRVVFATGFTDCGPYVPALQRFDGRGMFYCLHCDAYEVGDSPAFVLGRDDAAATDAMLLLNFTAEVDLLLDGDDPTWSDETDRQLAAHPVEVVEADVVDAYPADVDAEDPWLGGLTFGDGSERDYHGGFAMYGSEYNTSLAAALGCDLAEDGAIEVDADQETSVDGAYAVGDVTHGQNQTVLAMADGASAGMALHRDLRRFPVPVDELEERGSTPAAPAAASDLRARMRLLRRRETHAGLRGPDPRR